MIGIIVADENEIFYEKLQIKQQKQINQFTLVYFDVVSQPCVIVHSGIGVANAAAATQMLLSKVNVDVIYNYGAVGGNGDLQLYDLVAPRKIFYHDVKTPWYARGTVPHEAPFYLNQLVLPKNNNLATGSNFVSDKHYWIALKKELDVDIIDMEAAAIAQICTQNKVPVKIIKCISDIIGSNSNSTMHINKRIHKAAAKAFQKTLDLIASC